MITKGHLKLNILHQEHSVERLSYLLTNSTKQISITVMSGKLFELL